jgi:hypothetical protein
LNRNFSFIVFLTLNLIWGYNLQVFYTGRPDEAFAEARVDAENKEQAKGLISSEERSNPFLTLEEEMAIRSQPDAIPINYLILTAIFYSPANSRAIVDGEILKKGDFIDNKEIINISPEEIILKDNNSRYVLKMRGVFNTNQR